MKNLLLITTGLILSISSLAKEVILREAHESELYGTREVNQEFKTNPKLERAWVEIILSDNYQDGQEYNQTIRVKVANLKYNQETKEVYIDEDGRIVTCAYEKKWLFTTILKETGNCYFTKNYLKVEIDDGFTIRTENRYRLILNY